MKMRLGIAAIGLIIVLFSYLARAVSGNTGGGGSPLPNFSIGGGSNPESSALRTPESGAVSAMQALHNHDWRKLYYVCAFEANERKNASDAEDFDRELSRSAMVDHNPLTIFNLMAASSQFTCGSAAAHGNTAEVSTSWTIPYDGETLSLQGSAHMISQGGIWQLNLIIARTSLDDMLGQVISRTGHGPTIVIPHFGTFAPHNIPLPTPPLIVQPPAITPGPEYPVGPSGANPGYAPGFQPGIPQPGYNPPTYIPGPRFMPGPRFGPREFPRGPRFGPPNLPVGPGGGANPGSGGGGFGNSSGGADPPGGGGFGNGSGPSSSPSGDGASPPDGAQQPGPGPNGAT